MLKKCADGLVSRMSDHKRRYNYNGLFAHLPSKEDDIYINKVKKFVRDLGIDRACAEKYLGFPIEVTAAEEESAQRTAAPGRKSAPK